MVHHIFLCFFFYLLKQVAVSSYSCCTGTVRYHNYLFGSLVHACWREEKSIKKYSNLQYDTPSVADPGSKIRCFLPPGSGIWFRDELSL
jgi:hypothetical protein